MSVTKGRKVKVEYTGKLKDGTVFDKSDSGSPLEFTVGAGQIIPGFENGIEGMDVGDERTITIEPKDAYGEPNDNLVKTFERSTLPADFVPEKGMVVELQTMTGDVVPGTIIDVNDTGVTVDLNHPLAGKDLVFDVKVLEIA